jgi:hypothetical protein
MIEKCLQIKLSDDMLTKILVIKEASTDLEFCPNKDDPNKDDLHVVTIQKSCKLGDEAFLSYAIFFNDKALRGKIMTSRISPREKIQSGCIRYLTFTGAVITVAGFISLFLGTLALHWTITVMLAGATAAMIPVRMWACKGLADRGEGDLLTPKPSQLAKGFELDYLCFNHIMELKRLESCCGKLNHGDPQVQNSTPPKLCDNSSEVAKAALRVRTRSQELFGAVELPGEYQGKLTKDLSHLQRFSTNWANENDDLIDQLAIAITGVFKVIVQSRNGDFTQDLTCKKGGKLGGEPLSFQWSNKVFVQRSCENKLSQGEIELEVSFDQSNPVRNNVVIEKERLMALLSLWLYTIRLQNKGIRYGTYYRLLGGYTNPDDFKCKSQMYKDWLGLIMRGFAFQDFAIRKDDITLDSLLKTDCRDHGLYPVFGLNLSLLMVYVRQIMSPPSVIAIKKARANKLSQTGNEITHRAGEITKTQDTHSACLLKHIFGSRLRRRYFRTSCSLLRMR